MMHNGSVYVIGVDGVPPVMLEERTESGRLSTFASMREMGASGTTVSTTPPVSMMAWSTYATGQIPGNHPIYNFMIRGSDTPKASFANAKKLRSASIPFWEYLDAAGLSSGVMNVMPGHPPDSTRGFAISDHITTPSSGRVASPPEVEKVFREPFTEFEIGPPTAHGEKMDEAELEEYLERFFRVERERIEATKGLIQDYDCAVMSLVFSGPDVLLHEVGHLLDPEHPKHDEELAAEFGDAPMELLEAYDEFLSWLRDYINPEDTVIVLSDHGHGPVYSAVNLNSYLYQEGLLSLQSHPWTRLKEFGYNHVFDTVQTLLKRTGLYHPLKRAVARTSSGNDEGTNLAEFLTISHRDIDWGETSAYTVAGDGQVYIDAPSGEYERVRTEVRETLLSLFDPHRGREVIDEVLSGEEVYGDRYPKTRPDLVCVPNPKYRLTFPQTMKTNEPFVEPQKPGGHSSREESRGIFLASGGQVKEASGLELSLADYAPTILALADVPVPQRMDGSVRTDAFDVEERRERWDGRVRARRAIRKTSERLLSD